MSKLKDMTGRIYGYLSVQRRLPNYVQANGRKRTRWLCLCLLCGNAYVADGSHLLHGDIVSCGCLKNLKASKRMSAKKGTIQKNSRTKDIIGTTVNENIFVKSIAPSKNGKRTYLCKCLLCGTEFEARANHLLRGLIRSCGCVASFAEIEIRKYLNTRNINYKSHYWFDDFRSEFNKPYQFDFAFLDINNTLIALLEYQGEQHSPDKTQYFGKQQREITDPLKKEYCKKNNIKLYEIWYYQNIHEELDKIINEISHVNPVPSMQETA